MLDAHGRWLAGEPALAPAANELLAGCGAAAEAQGRVPDGLVLAARGDEVSVVLVLGPQSMPGLARHDLRLALGDLGARPPTGAATAATVPTALVERLIGASRRAPGAS